MLAYYSTLLKKEQLLPRMAQDADSLAREANELTCLIKVAAVQCNQRDLEGLLSSIEEVEEVVKVINAMLENFKGNVHAYTASLSSLHKEPTPVEQSKETEQKPTVDTSSVTTLLEGIKALKDMKDSLGA